MMAYWIGQYGPLCMPHQLRAQLANSIGIKWMPTMLEIQNGCTILFHQQIMIG